MSAPDVHPPRRLRDILLARHLRKQDGVGPASGHRVEVVVEERGVGRVHADDSKAVNRCPELPKAATKLTLAAAFSSGATASSRSKISASAASERDFSIARWLLAGR
jgi:hypothetical protein